MNRRLMLSVALLGAAAAAQVGRIDTIGFTTYDWQTGGPAYRMLVNAAAHGLHAGWIFSASTGTAFPDRNMRLNFYDYQTASWRWHQDGIDVFTERSGFGNLDCDPVSKAALVSAHAGHPILVARDTAPGAGVFEYCTGPSVYPHRAAFAAGANRWLHAAMIDAYGQLWYTRCTTWCQWTQPVHVSLGAEPDFPSYGISASGLGPRVALAWVARLMDRQPAYRTVSTDGGAVWPSPTQLPWPPAFSGDTLPAFYLGVFSYYDRRDRLHVVAEVLPVVGSQTLMFPAELWHWCADNDPQWARIHRAEATSSSLPAPIGYNAALAGRPSIGEDRSGGLYVAWEQFDTLNYEPLTGRLRADIWYARDNYDNGASWQAGVRITEPDMSSKRFPCVVDFLARDTMCVVYMVDSVAGFFVYDEGPGTRNPVVAQFVPVEVGGIETKPETNTGFGLEVRPSPFAGRARLGFSLTASGRVRLEVLDLAGRLVRTVVQAELHPGSHVVNWDGTDAEDRRVAAGTYFCVLEVNGRTVNKRMLLVR